MWIETIGKGFVNSDHVECFMLLNNTPSGFHIVADTARNMYSIKEFDDLEVAKEYFKDLIYRLRGEEHE